MGDDCGGFRGFGREAVVIFFVLSGYVISHVVEKKESKPLDYIASRFARIYSVALPSLILTIITYYIGNYINSEAFIKVTSQLGNPIITAFSALFFINQSWRALPVFSNFSYWSLGYEVLYYVFFGILCFESGLKRIVLLILVSVLMGPRVLLYLPIWLVGVLSHRLSFLIEVKIVPACILYVFSLVMVATLSFLYIQDAINSIVNSHIFLIIPQKYNESLDHIGSDYLLSIFVALNMFSFYFFGETCNVFNGNFVKIVRFASSYTFSLYLYHLPILFFFSAIIPCNQFPIVSFISCTFLTIVFIVIIGNFSEREKRQFIKEYSIFSFRKFLIESMKLRAVFFPSPAILSTFTPQLGHCTRLGT